MLVKRHVLAKPSVTESRFESKPKWNQGGEADGVFLGKMDLSDEVIAGTPQGNRDDTTIQTNDGRSSVESPHVCRTTVEPVWHHH